MSGALEECVGDVMAYIGHHPMVTRYSVTKAIAECVMTKLRREGALHKSHSLEALGLALGHPTFKPQPDFSLMGRVTYQPWWWGEYYSGVGIDAAHGVLLTEACRRSGSGAAMRRPLLGWYELRSKRGF